MVQIANFEFEPLNFYETYFEVMLKFTNFADAIQEEENGQIIVKTPEVDNTDVRIVVHFTIEGRNKTVR